MHNLTARQLACIKNELQYHLKQQFPKEQVRIAVSLKDGCIDYHKYVLKQVIVPNEQAFQYSYLLALQDKFYKQKIGDAIAFELGESQIASALFLAQQDAENSLKEIALENIKSEFERWISKKEFEAIVNKEYVCCELIVYKTDFGELKKYVGPEGLIFYRQNIFITGYVAGDDLNADLT